MEDDFSGVCGLSVVWALRNAKTPDKASDIPASARITAIVIRAGRIKVKPGTERAKSHANAAQRTMIAGGGILRFRDDIVWGLTPELSRPATNREQQQVGMLEVSTEAAKRVRLE